MTIHVTVALDLPTKAAAQQRVEAAGFTVVRATVKREPAAQVAPVNGLVRASALTDMPEGLDKLERAAYIRGYAKGAHAYVKKHGAPTIRGVVTRAGVVELRKKTKQFEWERHPSCHTAGMRELRKYREHPSRIPIPTPLEVAV